MTQVTVQQALQIGLAHHQAGRLVDAESVYRQILAADPRNLDAMHLLGVLHTQTGRVREGVDLLARVAADARPPVPGVYANLASALRMAGDHARAVDACHAALGLDRGLPNVWTTLAASLVDLGRLDDAANAWRERIALTPDSAEAWSNLGVTYERMGRLADAEDACRRAVALDPRYAPAHNNLGAALAAAGRLDEARQAHLAAVDADPGFARAYVNLAHTTLLMGRLEESVSAARTAVRLAPDDVDARRNLAAALHDLGDVSAAAEAYDAAVNLLAPHAAFLSPAARELLTRLRLVSATLLPQVYKSKDDLLRWRDRLSANVSALACDGVRADLTHEPAPTLFALAYHGLDDRPLAETFASLLAPPPPATGNPPLATRAGRSARVKVAFLSRFFRDHTIGRLNLGLVRQLDRRRFDVTVLSVGDPRDDVSAAFRAAADRHVVLPPQLPAARALIADAAPDVLFYTDLGMDPVTYSLAFSRLAPVQCTTWGHPVTSGVPAVDYFLSSEDLELGGSDAQYTERLVRLKHLAVYYDRPALPGTPSRVDLGLDPSWTLYGCLQMLWKFHPDFDPLLAGVLRADPRGRLLLIRGLHRAWDGALTRRWSRTMPDVLDRVVWLERLPRDRFLALTSLCDVMLDPTPFCGGNTSYEAFAFGVPVVTLPTRFLRGRLTYAMCRRMSLGECVATGPEDYVTRAVSVATDPARRQTVRAKLRDRSPALFENAAAVREFEDFLLQVARG